MRCIARDLFTHQLKVKKQCWKTRHNYHCNNSAATKHSPIWTLWQLYIPKAINTDPTLQKSVETDWLRVSENRVLRRVFGPKSDQLTGEWRKPHNEELTDLYSLPNIVWVVKSRRMRWAGHVARMGEDRGVHRVLVGKPEGKRPLGRPRRRWEDNMKMDLQEVGGARGDWMELAQDRDGWRALVGTVRNFRVP